jgi:hypothetical protein
MTNHARKPAPADETALALSLVVGKLDGMDRRQQASDQRTEQRLGAVDQRLDSVDRRLGTLEQRLDTFEHRTDQRLTTLEEGQSRIEGLLARLLDGQAVLLQNDMELKRRLDRQSQD